MKPKTFKLWTIIISIVLLFNIFVSIYENRPESLLWFCFTLLIVLAVGIYYKNTLLLSSVITSSLLLELAWTIDLVAFLTTGTLLLGVADYFQDLSKLRFTATLYHLFLLIIPAYFILKTKAFHKKAWLFSSAHFLVISISSLILTKSNINYVKEAGNLGIFNFIYLIKPALMPFFIFHWIALTVLIFIPTNIIFYYLISNIFHHNKPYK